MRQTEALMRLDVTGEIDRFTSLSQRCDRQSQGFSQPDRGMDRGDARL